MLEYGYERLVSSEKEIQWRDREIISMLYGGEIIE